MLRCVNGVLLIAGALKVAAAESVRGWLHYTFGLAFPIASIATAVIITVEIASGLTGVLSPTARPRALAMLFAALLGAHLLVVTHPEWGTCPCLGSVDTGRGWSWGNGAMAMWCLLGAILNARAGDSQSAARAKHFMFGRRRMS